MLTKKYSSNESLSDYQSQLTYIQKEIEEREMTWEERVEEALNMKISEEKKANLDEPHIINLNEDPQLDRQIAYDV